MVVAILLIGAMLSRKGIGGSVGLLLEDFSVEILVDDSANSWSIAYQVNSWFLSGPEMVLGFLTGRSENDSRETMLPFPRIILGMASGRGSKLSRYTLVVSLF